MRSPSPNPGTVRLTLSVFVALTLLLTVPGLAQTDWVSYTEETDTRLVADASVGSADTQEKDIVAGDVDQDGDSDVLISRKNPFSNPGGARNVLLMNENGVLTDRTATLAPEMMDVTDDRDIVLVDVDGDTWLDAVTVTTFGEQARVYMNLGETGGVWQGFEYNAADNRLPTFNPGPKFCAVGFGDVTGDNAPDLYFVDYDNTLEDRLVINDGNGFFTDETTLRMTPDMYDSTFGTDAHILDMNGDGWNDIVKDNASGMSPPPGFDSAVHILYNDGTGNFDFNQRAYELAPYMVEPADFDGNGRMDLYVVDDSQDSYMLNTGNDAQDHAIFQINTVTGSPNTQGFGGNTKIHDLDNDGLYDVLIADVDTDIPGCDDRELVILQGQGTQPNVSFSDPLNGASRPWLPSGTFDLEALHIDDDGVLDLVIGTCDGLMIFMGAIPTVFRDGFESGDTTVWSSTGS